MGTTIPSATTFEASRNPIDNVDAFVDAVLSEIAAMQKDGVKVRTKGPKASMDDDRLRRCIMAIWFVAYSGAQWRSIGFLAGIPHGTIFSLFLRWTRIGLWNRLMLRLAVAWRKACGDTPMPSAICIDSRSCRSAPSCGFRGIDGGKRVKGVKFHVGADKHGSVFSVDVSPANVHDTKGIVPVVEDLAELGFVGGALGDLGYRGEELDKIAKAVGLAGIDAVAGGRNGVFVPAGIRWVVERTFAWASFYRRLNVIFERKAEHMVAFFEIMMISILSRRLSRLVAAR